MVATVLIGKDSKGAGVVAKIFDGAQVDGGITRDLRGTIANRWVLLDGALVLKTTNDMVIRLSRHAASDGAIWTWLGCYQQASFPDNVRGGTYIGSGVVEQGHLLHARAAVSYATNLLTWLYEFRDKSTDILAMSVLDIDPKAMETLPEDLVLAEPAVQGLRPQPVRLFIDLQAFGTKSTFDAKLLELIDEAQRLPEFAGFGELLIGNTPALADQARRSGAYRIYTPDQWRAEVQRRERELSMARDRAVDAMSTRKTALRDARPGTTVPSAWQEHIQRPVAPRGETSMEGLRAEIQALETRLGSRFDELLSMLRSRPVSARSVGILAKWWPFSVEAGLMLALLVALMALAAVLLVGRGNHEVEVPGRAPANATGAAPQVCEPTSIPLGTLNEEAIRKLDDERLCLNTALDVIESRIRVVAAVRDGRTVERPSEDKGGVDAGITTITPHQVRTHGGARSHSAEADAPPMATTRGP